MFETGIERIIGTQAVGYICSDKVLRILSHFRIETAFNRSLPEGRTIKFHKA